MSDRITIRPLPWYSILADWLLVIPMYIGSGVWLKLFSREPWAVTETPQRTHRWNNHHLPFEDAQLLDRSIMLRFKGDREANPRGIVRFHLRIMGGWGKYLVLQPVNDLPKGEKWYVGWMGGDHDLNIPSHVIAGKPAVKRPFGVSRLPLKGSVRVLLGPDDIAFFGINEHGKQIELRWVFEDYLGGGGQYRHRPLR